jgi:D-beta-D-heptose 7-phosphate kinase/D-beta-D-heptose 1-phosphate adenosyltransferase
MSEASPAALLTTIERFDAARVLVVGDVMLDVFVYGQAERLSPEAPIPVLKIQREVRMLGGAGNVTRNIASLGAHASVVSVVGEDTTAVDIHALIAEEPQIDAHFVSETTRISTLKTRYIAASQQLLRADREEVTPASAGSIAAMLSAVEARIANHHVLILSDYAKGALTPALVKPLIALARTHNVPVFVDPKQWDVALYAGATLISPNEKEMQQLHGAPFADDGAMIAAAQGWCKAHCIGYVLITRGAKGMMLVHADGVVATIASEAREVFDVSGAGDTVMATLAVAHGSGADISHAARLANVAAGIVVGRMGTATVHRTDLKTAVHTAHLVSGAEKIFSREALKTQVGEWQAKGLKVGFTNGCFDVIHAGHIASLASAKSYCDRLVIAINSDASVKRLKGESRPIHAEMDRAMVLAALGAVDGVTLFREDTPEALLELLRPDVLMKGADYQKEQIVGWQLVESYGGKVVRIPLVEGYSSTNTISKIQKQGSM